MWRNHSESYFWKPDENSYLNSNGLHWDLSMHAYKTNISKYFPFAHIYVHILCGFSDIRIIMTTQKRCYARDSQNRISTMHGSSTPISELRLQISVSWCFRNKYIIHVIIGFRHDLSCNVRSEAVRGPSNTSVHESLTDPRSPFVSPTSQCTVHHA